MLGEEVLDVLESAKSGSKEGSNKFLSLIRPHVSGIVRKHLRCIWLLEDTTQEAMIRIYIGLPNVRANNVTMLADWINKISRRQASNTDRDNMRGMRDFRKCLRLDYSEPGCPSCYKFLEIEDVKPSFQEQRLQLNELWERVRVFADAISRSEQEAGRIKAVMCLLIDAKSQSFIAAKTGLSRNDVSRVVKKIRKHHECLPE